MNAKELLQQAKADIAEKYGHASWQILCYRCLNETIEERNEEASLLAMSKQNEELITELKSVLKGPLDWNSRIRITNLINLYEQSIP